MTEKNWASFSEWKKIVAETNCGVESPFNDTLLTDDSIFLWNQTGTPLPSGSTNGAWGSFPEPKALVGFLRYVALPVFFEIWLVREEWDKEPERFIKAEELFELAEQSGKCRYIEDTQLMKTLIADLDVLMEQDNEKVTMDLTAVVKKFNERWENTPTWCFKLEIYESPVMVGKEIFNRVADEIKDEYVEEEFGMAEKDWMNICQKALTDKTAQDQFSERLREAGWY
jgi:hypothetical protein